MKRTFWTRNLFMGVLMGLVMALGVQGTAEAETVTRRSGDLQLTNVRDTFTISFRVSDIDDDDTLDLPGSTDLTLKKIGSSVVDSTSVVTLYEAYDADTHESYQRLRATTYTLTYAADSAGEKDITIGGVEFTVYVVDDAARAAVGTTIAITGGEYAVRGNQNSAISITVTGDDNLPVTYSVSGGGRIYVQHEDGGDRKTSEKTSLTTSTEASVWLDMRSRTNKVTVTIQGLDPDTTTYIYGNPRLQKVSGTDQEGIAGGRLEEPLVVKLVDFGGRAVSDVPVVFSAGSTGSEVGEFMAIPGTTLYMSGRELRPATSTSPPDANPFTAYTNSRGEAHVYYQFESDQSGSVSVTAAVTGTTASTIFTPEVGSSRRRPILEILSGNNQRTDKYGEIEDPLVVVVTQAGRLKPGEQVEFRTVKGTLDGYTEATTDNDPVGEALAPRNDKKRVWSITNGSGQAEVMYYQDPGSGSDTVTVAISGDNYEREVVFSINGSSTRVITPPDDDDDDEEEEEDDRTITVRPASLSGAAGAVVPLGLLPTTATFTVTGNSAFTSAGGVVRGTGALRDVRLPNTAGTGIYSLTVSASGYTTKTISVTVTAAAPAPAPTPGSGTLSIRTIGTATNGQQIVEVTGPAGVTVTLSGTGFGTRTVTTGSNGSVRAVITLPTTVGSHTLIASATGYTSDSVTIRVSEQTTPREPTPPPTPTGGTPNRISISGLTTHSGAVDTPLELPLTVRVLDASGVGVANAKVTFRVRQGDGQLSDRGNGRARIVETDQSGYARAAFTPESAGTITVEATVKGITQKVTFIINTGSAPPTDTTGLARQYKVGDRLPGNLSGTYNFSGKLTINDQTYTCLGVGECVISNGVVTKGQVQVPAAEKPEPKVTTRQHNVGDSVPGNLSGTYNFSSKLTINDQTYTCLSSGECVISNGVVTKGQVQTTVTTTPKDTEITRTISPVVHIAAARRPSMLWVDGGAIYVLVDADVQRFAPNMQNVISLAIGAGKLYWTEKTGESSGTINSANLDGTGVKELTSILAVPMGIAVDEANSKLYWTNSRGRIQSANLDGSGIKNVIQNLTSPEDIALASGKLYWTHGNGGVGFVNLKGQQQVRSISNGADAAGSLAIANGKVYWTEQIGDSGGTINAANLNGTGATEIASILAAPMGIAVDTARSRLVWTNARGRIQSANLDGTNIQNVVSGLGSPSEIILGNSIKAPKTTETVAKTDSTGNKYDVNGDGSVDDKDVDAIIVAVAAKITAAKYDVNADGKVDFNDVVAVSANKGSAANAPTLLGRKFSALEVKALQEQIDLLIASGDRSPAAIKTLIYLQQLIAMARPEKTQLLANYPNPFNPETWIPYELATDTNVRITIYTPTGVVVRTLTLGHQTAGYYTDRERAAYWDGRNASGEQVASGIYFYQLETDEMSTLRKMVILK